MPELISNAKSWTNPISFDTYVPLLSDPADIGIALKLFFFGNSDNGNNFEENSIYSHLINLNNLATLSYSGSSLHDTQSNNVHGIGSGNVVGTTTVQELSNKTLTDSYISSPKINENVGLTATSSKLNIFKGATLTTVELNKLSGASVSTSEINTLYGVTSSIQSQLNLKQNASTTGLVLINTSSQATPGLSFWSISNIFNSMYDSYKIILSSGSLSVNNSSIFLYPVNISGLITTTYPNVYYGGKKNINYSGTITNSSASTTYGWNLGEGSNEGFYSEIDIFNPFLSKPKSIRFETSMYSTTGSNTYGGGYTSLNSSINSIQIAVSSGTFSGLNISIYGYKNKE